MNSVASHEEWLVARKALLEKEKLLARLEDVSCVTSGASMGESGLTISFPEGWLTSGKSLALSAGERRKDTHERSNATQSSL